MIALITLPTLQGKEHFELVEVVSNSRYKIIDPPVSVKKKNQAFHSKKVNTF